jgi:TfoX/Sxy family transcriptional regulator of competence genes
LWIEKAKALAMATSDSTMKYLLDQLRTVPSVQAKKMFGEYCLYVDSKPVALVCNDTLYLKPSTALLSLSADCAISAPYSGAKPHLVLGADVLENHVLLAQLLVHTAAALPVPKPKTFISRQ